MEYAGYDLHEGGFTTGSPSWNEWKGIYPVVATGNMDTENINCPVINISLTLSGYTMPFNNEYIYLSRQYTLSRGVAQDLHNFFVQLVAYDSNNNVVAASNVLNFCTPKSGEYFPLSKYIETGTYRPDGGVTREQVIQGEFKLTDSATGLYKFSSQSGNNFDLSLGQNVSYSYLRIKITKVGFSRATGGGAWSLGTTNLNQYYLGDGTNNWVTAVTTATVLQVNASSANYPTGEQIASGAIIKKTKLLKSDFTPAEYLIGYTKVFGLYYDVHIDTKTVDIKPRNKYYSGNVIDINQDIDRDKEIRITPLSFDKKFYDLKYKEDNKSQFLEQYSDTYSKTYGQQAINTNYEFNNDRKNLLDNVPYQSAIECLEKSKYYRDLYTRRLSRPIWTIVPWEYTLWRWDTSEETYDSTSKDMPGVPTKYATYWNSMEGYDIFPKLQFRDDSNSPVDSKNVLVFFNGFKGLQNSSGGTIPMWLTDENSAMLEINDGKPCWLYTERESDINGTPIAIKITQLPVFGRYRTGNNNAIELSWDFGEPLELYDPTLSTSPESTIYNQYWKTYITDLYSVNTRVVTAYVRFKTPLSKENLKHFYWFDNSYWVINKIIDYNPDKRVTKIEFVKVNNTKAYTDNLNINTNDYLIVNPTSISFNTTLTGISNIQSNLVWGAYIVYEDSTAQTFNASISTQQFDLNGGSAIITINADSALTWTISGESWMTLSTTAGTGNSTSTLTIPPTSSTRSGSIVVSGSNGNYYTWTISQSVTSVSIIPSGVTQEIPEHSSGVVYTQSFQSNVPFTVSVSDNWISAWTEGTSVKFCATSNNEGQSPRIGQINLIYNNTTYATITATQMTESVEYYALFDNNTTSYTYTFASGVVDTYTGVSVSSNVEYEVETNQNWLSARTVEGGIEFCCLTENQTGQERSGNVSIVYDYQTLAVATITQQESTVVVDSIEPDTNLVEFAASDLAYKTINIAATPNMPWTVTTTSGFVLNPSFTALTGNGYIQVHPTSYNRTDNNIEGTITIQSSSVTANVSTIQYKSMVKIDGTGSTYDCHATSFTITVSAETNWSAITDGWLTLSSTSGASGVSAITVTLAKNTEDDPWDAYTELPYRSANIQFNYNEYGVNTYAIYTVKQYQSNLKASISTNPLPYYSGSTNLNVSSTTEVYGVDVPEWEIVAPSWITVPQDAVSGQGTTSITIYYGNTQTSRNGHIYVYDKADHDFYADVYVEQPYNTANATYSIDWKYGMNDSKPQFHVDGYGMLTSITFDFVTVNWWDIDDGAKNKNLNYKFEVIEWNDDYTSWDTIGTYTIDANFPVPTQTGSSIEQSLVGVEISGMNIQSYTNYELRTELEPQPQQTGAVTTCIYSGANYNSVFYPPIGIAKYNTPYFGSNSSKPLTRVSEGSGYYHYVINGYLDIAFVLDENALNCDFNVNVSVSCDGFTFYGTVTGTTPSSSSTVRVNCGFYSNSTTKYITDNALRSFGVSATPTSKSGATSSTGCSVIFKPNNS